MNYYFRSMMILLCNYYIMIVHYIKPMIRSTWICMDSPRGWEIFAADVNRNEYYLGPIMAMLWHFHSTDLE